jgi:hypothetical protein
MSVIEFVDAPTGNGEGTEYRFFAAGAAARDAVLSNSREYLKQMISAGDLPPLGCSCSHCQNDWDCCGRLYPSHHSVLAAEGGFKVATRYERNI